ncbi:MAG: STAS domain-containing protein [Candidatus Muiribacteriota bacterium]
MENKITVNQKNERIFIVNFEGFFNNDDDTDKLTEVLNGIYEKKPKRIILNFKKTQYINSSIIGVMVHFYKILPETHMQIYCKNPFIKELFQITSIDKIFDMLETEHEIQQQL